MAGLAVPQRSESSAQGAEATEAESLRGRVCSDERRRVGQLARKQARSDSAEVKRQAAASGGAASWAGAMAGQLAGGKLGHRLRRLGRPRRLLQRLRRAVASNAGRLEGLAAAWQKNS